MRLRKYKRLWLKTTAGPMLALFLLWSFIYSLHFLFAEIHAKPGFQDHCHNCKACCGLSFNEPIDENIVELNAIAEHNECSFCIFAAKFHNTGISAIFTLECRFFQTGGHFCQFFSLPFEVEIVNHSRAPPYLIV